MRFLRERQDVIDTCHRLSARGYLAGVGGNVALRIDEALFAVTPSGADYATMEPADIAVLDLRSLARVDGRRTPSVESRLHARVFTARPDVMASVHTHQPVASAVALLGAAVDLSGHADAGELGPRMELVAYGPSGTGFLVRALAQRLVPGVNAYLFANHGLICLGASLERAEMRVELAERAAARWLEAAMPQGADTPLTRCARDGLSPFTTRSP